METSESHRMNGPTVEVGRVHPRASLPRKMSEGASGWDICACLGDQVQIEPGCWAMVSTGIALAIPEGYEAQVRPRSGLAARHGVGLLNGPGTIDSDYRGEVRVILMNWGRERFCVNHGDRIAQLVFARVEPVQLQWAEKLQETTRGAGGFGHTGINSTGGKPS